MDWYMLKTWPGREEELVREIRRTVPPGLYQDCFVITQERIWRKQQKSIIHVEPLFPGCVFLTCKGKEKRASFWRRLEQVPAIGRRMACKELALFPVMEEDAKFLARISGKDHVVRLSYVEKNEQGQISKVSEPLKACQGQVERYQFKKRYAMVRHTLWGEEQAIVLGIMLKEDRDQESPVVFQEAPLVCALERNG